MKSLNMVTNMGKATTVTAIGVLVAFLFLVPVFANATSYTLTVKTDQSSYATGATVTVSGTVTPAPAAGTAVGISVISPSGAQVAFISPQVTAGSYSGTFVTGGTGNWVSGTFTVTAKWADNATGPAYAESTTFTYTASGPTTSSVTQTNVTTTIISQVTTTIVESSAVTTTVVASPPPAVTTIITQVQTLPGTTVTQVVSSIVSSITTVSSGGGSSADLPIAIVGVVIAIVAGALAVVALRRK